MPRGSSTAELKKKREKLFTRPNSAIGRTKNSNQTNTKTTAAPAKKLSAKERAQKMAKERIAAKKAGTYKKPKTAQELAKERLKIKNKKK